MILDSSAVLAAIFREPGRDVVLDALTGDAFISAVNLAEVISKMLDRGFTEQQIRGEFADLRLEARDFGESDAAEAGFLRPLTRALGLSLGDRACIALARRGGQAVLTADRNWSLFNLGVDVHVIR